MFNFHAYPPLVYGAWSVETRSGDCMLLLENTRSPQSMEHVHLSATVLYILLAREKQQKWFLETYNLL